MRFRVVLLPFPFDDLSGQKVRPAVCLTDAIGTHRHLVVAFITSTVPTTLEPTDILLAPGTPDFASTGLRVVHAASPPSGYGVRGDYSAADGRARSECPGTSPATP